MKKLLIVILCLMPCVVRASFKRVSEGKPLHTNLHNEAQQQQTLQGLQVALMDLREELDVMRAQINDMNEKQVVFTQTVALLLKSQKKQKLEQNQKSQVNVEIPGTFNGFML